VNRRFVELLSDPLIAALYDQVRRAGPLRSISIDISNRCNIRCKGCYFFAEDMDVGGEGSDADFEALIEREKARGTNYVTVIGGEPSLELARLRKIRKNFSMAVVTNGLRRIPCEGLDDIPIGISVWGDHEADRMLRGGGRVDVFRRALSNYRGDPRAVWYYTVAAGRASEIESVVSQCVENGNYLIFNFYGDLEQAGGQLDHSRGFEDVLAEIERMIARYPERILTSTYMSRVVATGRLGDQRWGYDVCSSVSADNPVNAARIQNGNPTNLHFRAYNADFSSTRRCCVGSERDCSTCFDVWSHVSWIILNGRRAKSDRDILGWITSMYLFYLVNHIVEFEQGIKLLPEIHRALAMSDAANGRPDVRVQ